MSQVVNGQDIVCRFCGGVLGEIEKQEHPNPDFAEFRTCLTCGYQWAKRYWSYLAKMQGVDLKENKCRQWGANRVDEGFIDVGCVLGHSWCDPSKCVDFGELKSNE